MEKLRQALPDLIKVLIGCILFALGFDLFLVPCELNAGGITGISMLIHQLLHRVPVGTITVLLNVPLFLVGGVRIGRRFLAGSLFGMLVSSVAIDFLECLPTPSVDPLLGGIYGGLLCGIGLGLVFTTGLTTGGSDIVVRLLQRRWRHLQIGYINICLDASVAILTGIVFHDLTRTLYSGVAIAICGWAVDAVVYRFDDSRVAIIISDQYEVIAARIGEKLGRGTTFLHGEGSFNRTQTEVLLTAVRRHQLTELQKLVMQLDPKAFIIVQQAHQVLGDGFSEYSI